MRKRRGKLARRRESWASSLCKSYSIRRSNSNKWGKTLLPTSPQQMTINHHSTIRYLIKASIWANPSLKRLRLPLKQETKVASSLEWASYMNKRKSQRSVTPSKIINFQWSTRIIILKATWMTTRHRSNNNNRDSLNRSSKTTDKDKIYDLHNQ